VIKRLSGIFIRLFQYTDNNTKKAMTRKLKSEDFIALVLQHTLAKEFRRARELFTGKWRGFSLMISWIKNYR
jgi:hypothetical protein